MGVDASDVGLLVARLFADWTIFDRLCLAMVVPRLGCEGDNGTTWAFFIEILEMDIRVLAPPPFTRGSRRLQQNSSFAATLTCVVWGRWFPLLP